MSSDEIKSIFKNSKTKSDVCRKLGLHTNGSGIRKVTKLIEQYNIDISHFDNGTSKKIKYDIIIKECPVCGNFFETKKGYKREKQTCSHSCSNTYFRSGKNNPNYKGLDNVDENSKYYSVLYRRVCFENHEHKCVVCSEDKLLDVHHYDGDRANNNPENLIPLCATHHRYVHSKYRKTVIGKINNYRNWFINNMGVE